MLPNGNDAKLYGTGTDLDQLVTAGAELTYNVPPLEIRFGIYLKLCMVWFTQCLQRKKIQRYSCRMQQPYCCCCHVYVLTSLHNYFLIIYLSPVTDYYLMI